MILDSSRLVAPASLFNNIRFELPLEVYLEKDDEIILYGDYVSNDDNLMLVEIKINFNF